MAISNPVKVFNLQNHTQRYITRNSMKKALVVIDSKIDNYQSLVAGVIPNSDVIIIYPEDDAISKISQQIDRDPEISSIHLVSHGSPGCLYWGNNELSLNTLSDYAQELSKWQERESLDILIYGCNVGAGDVGEKFLHKLREITQAKGIAVSANKTGNKELGGDWNLEIRLGNVEPTLAFHQEVRENYVEVFYEVVLAAERSPTSKGSSPESLTVFNSELYFGAFANSGVGLWKYNPSNGASIVTNMDVGVLVGSSTTSQTVFNGELYFGAYDVINGGRELWKYNPTDGASLVAGIYSDNGTSYPEYLTVFDNELYFSLDDGINGEELWKYNPTDGAFLVADINPGRFDSSPRYLTVFNDELYFRADDGTNGIELWKYNPTDGTSLAADINPGSPVSDNYDSSYPSDLTVFNGELYFGAYDVTNSGRELWKYNPTDGASLVADILPGRDSSNPAELTVFNGELYFNAAYASGNDGINIGYELWKYNPTDGASLVADISPGSGSSGPKELTVFNGELYFSASNADGTSFRGLWKYNSTNGVSFINPVYDAAGLDINYYNPEHLTVLNGKLYFSAYAVYDGKSMGRNLLVLQGNAVPIAVDDSVPTAENTVKTILAEDLLANDFDADSETLSITGVDNAVNGTVSLDELSSEILFTPTSEFSGSASFEYTVSDGTDTATATVTIRVGDEISRGFTVYRFFNSSAGVHFYTPSETEKDYVDDNLENYTYEGESYVTVDHLTGNSAQAVYRFFNSTTGVHLYTTSESERDYIIENLSNFAYEDITFYAYETEQVGTVPIHRFYEPSLGVHFYTPNEEEKIFVEENLLNYNYEGIAYYAYPISDTDSI